MGWSGFAGRLWRRYLLALSLMFASVTFGFVATEESLRAVTEYGEARRMVEAQRTLSQIIEAAAEDYVEGGGQPHALEASEARLRALAARFEADHERLVASEGARASPAAAALFGQSGPQVDRFSRAMLEHLDRALVGGAGGRAALEDLEALTDGPLLGGLDALARVYEALDAEQQGRLAFVSRCGFALALLVLALEFLLIFRPAHGAVVEALGRRDGALDAERRANADLRATVDMLDAARREAVAARAEAERADRLKTEFLAHFNHEVRTPLNAIIGLSELVARAGLGEADRARLSLVRENGRSLTAMLEDTIDLARITSGDFELEPAPFDPRALARAACAPHSRAAEKKGLRFTLDLDPRLPALFVGDARRIGRLIGALTENAVKFTGAGAVSAALRPWGRRGLEIVVADTGVGVRPDRREAIFEHFLQIDGAETRSFGGVGQGLALARLVVRAMGGEIGIEDGPEGGARFRVTLPLLAVESPGRHRSVASA
jgi:signal transduction histidine kinase